MVSLVYMECPRHIKNWLRAQATTHINPFDGDSMRYEAEEISRRLFAAQRSGARKTVNQDSLCLVVTVVAMNWLNTN